MAGPHCTIQIQWQTEYNHNHNHNHKHESTQRGEGANVVENRSLVRYSSHCGWLVCLLAQGTKVSLAVRVVALIRAHTKMLALRTAAGAQDLQVSRHSSSSIEASSLDVEASCDVAVAQIAIREIGVREIGVREIGASEVGVPESGS